eukprot:365460-Chlamydomonas_euryale.AAC.5
MVCVGLRRGISEQACRVSMREQACGASMRTCDKADKAVGPKTLHGHPHFIYNIFPLYSIQTCRSASQNPTPPAVSVARASLLRSLLNIRTFPSTEKHLALLPSPTPTTQHHLPSRHPHLCGRHQRRHPRPHRRRVRCAARRRRRPAAGSALTAGPGLDACMGVPVGAATAVAAADACRLAAWPPVGPDGAGRASGSEPARGGGEPRCLATCRASAGVGAGIWGRFWQGGR